MTKNAPKSRRLKNPKITDNTSMCSQIQRFINNGDLRDECIRREFHPFPSMKFVSFDDGVVRILLSGRCPTCECLHMRDVCIFNYNLTVTTPIIKDLFSMVQEIIAVSTTDEDFEVAVALAGGVVRYPYESNIEGSFYKVKQFILDLHPSFDTTYKMV